MLAMEAGLTDGGTRERIQALTRSGVLSREQADNLASSFNYLVHQRLRSQVVALRRQRTPDNYVELDQLNRMEQGRLRLALDEVATFQTFLTRRYQLDLLR